MSLEFLVACGETTFRFNPDALREAAPVRWPHARITPPFEENAHLVDCDIYIETADGDSLAEIAVYRSGEGIGLDAATEGDAAAVLAWLASMPGLTEDGSVVVVHWQNDLYPLRPGISAEELLADRHV